MSERFVNVDRDTPMLLPVDLRDWVPGDDMVHFVVEAVERMRFLTVKVNSNRKAAFPVSTRGRDVVQKR